MAIPVPTAGWLAASDRRQLRVGAPARNDPARHVGEYAARALTASHCNCNPPAPTLEPPAVRVIRLGSNFAGSGPGASYQV